GGTGGSGGGTGGTAEPAGLIAFWRFDEGSGTTVVDSSGNGQTLTLSASGSDWATGHAGGGLSVDGTSGYAGVVPFNGQELYSYPVYNLSFSAWIKPDPAAASLSFATAVARAHEDYLFEDFWLGLVDGRPACMIHNPNWQGAVATAAAPAGAWTHIACTYDSTIAVTLYVDGAYAASTSSTEGLGPIPTRILVGAAETDALQAFFPGVIDDVRIYKTTLTLSEVASIAK
ncbi:MAG TPA: LamG domain-containing protein, partial [Polyangia bacterium]|nr:LamG domain-containing protein [Polyangia bacterium]